MRWYKPTHASTVRPGCLATRTTHTELSGVVVSAGCVDTPSEYEDDVNALNAITASCTTSQGMSTKRQGGTRAGNVS
jgi:hypothetical protein